MIKAKGYRTAFIGHQLKVKLPQPCPEHKKDLARLNDSRSTVLRYLHFSSVLSRKRRFPLFTAVNINGKTFREIKRDSLFPGGSDRWTLDERARDHQWGDELYSVEDSHFDKGHLVKREDPQWGKNIAKAAEAARSTFYYTNCAPQVAELNRREWRNLEDYILKKESSPNKLRICVFTGPVLSDKDPVFVRPVQGQEVQIPVLFWKVIYFTADGKTLKRVAFLMGQKKLLQQKKIVRPKTGVPETVEREPALFIDFKDAATYQVNISTVERLTGLSFSPASEPYKDSRLSRIVLKEVEVEERFPGKETLDYELEGLVLR